MRAAEHRSGGTAVDKEATPEVMVEQPPTGESGDREDSPGVQATDPALTEEAADTGAEALDLATSEVCREWPPSPQAEAVDELAAGEVEGRVCLCLHLRRW